MDKLPELSTTLEEPNGLDGRVHLKDRHGNDLCFARVGDLIMPDFTTIKDYHQHRKNIRELDLKPEDIILAGYPKTGNHWMAEIIHMLMAGSATYNTRSVTSDFIDLMPSISNPPDSAPRMFTTHLLLHHYPKQVWEKKVKIVYLQRNPKDTWVSLYNHASGMTKYFPAKYGGTWSHFFDVMISFGYWYGDWFEYVQDWEREIEANTELQIFSSHFEDMKRDPVGQIERVDAFLGYNRDRQLYEQIADACSFAKLKTIKDGEGGEAARMKMLFKPDAPGFYRKGDVGDWKNWFTVAQNELFDEVYKKRMADSKLQYTYVL